jgi:NAD(P)-dependent dehydrogenase (short-subunit alcohol dehydrogenase family)
MSKRKVVVAGATGSLGIKIVKELLAQGADVTAMVRASSNFNGKAQASKKKKSSSRKKAKS